MPYHPADDRYAARKPEWFRRCGRSGLMLPAISLGCWHNFGAAGTDSGRHTDESAMHENCRAMLHAAFDHGITHFDLANNYGPPPGAAEERVGKILHQDFAHHRDELIIASKAGYRMWPGPYGEWGSRKYLIASCEASLKRLGLDYVDLFYSHRPDPHTPLDETLGALDSLVKQGKALYTGISSYRPGMTADALRTCEQHGLTQPIIHQPSYSMLDRWIEPGLTDVCGQLGVGMIVFCPLAQGLLTDKYLDGIPADSRAASEAGFLKKERITEDLVGKLRKLQRIAGDLGVPLATLALRWVLRDARVTSALIGASRPSQIVEACGVLDAPALDDTTLRAIDEALG